MELDPKFVDVIVARYVAHQNGNDAEVFVLRNGQRLLLSEALAAVGRDSLHT
ncbi:MAG: hypothetical protein ACI4TG_08475 [Ruminococcus sp.]